MKVNFLVQGNNGDHDWALTHADKPPTDYKLFLLVPLYRYTTPHFNIVHKCVPLILHIIELHLSDTVKFYVF